MLEDVIERSGDAGCVEVATAHDDGQPVRVRQRLDVVQVLPVGIFFEAQEVGRGQPSGQCGLAGARIAEDHEPARGCKACTDWLARLLFTRRTVRGALTEPRFVPALLHLVPARFRELLAGRCLDAGAQRYVQAAQLQPALDDAAVFRQAREIDDVARCKEELSITELRRASRLVVGAILGAFLGGSCPLRCGAE